MESSAFLKTLHFVITRFPESARAYLELGSGYEHTGEIERAIKNYRQVSRLEPQNDVATTTLKELQQIQNCIDPFFGRSKISNL